MRILVQDTIGEEPFTDQTAIESSSTKFESDVGERRHSQAVEQKAQVIDVIIQDTWAEDIRSISREEGAYILYDELTHALDPQSKRIWPPRLVVLSSL